MAMDWIEYLRESRKRAGGLMKVSPKLVAGFQAVSAKETTTGALEPKVRELIALAVSITTRCESCIAAHASEARRLGVTDAELADALATAIALNAGAAYVYSGRALEAFEQFKSA